MDFPILDVVGKAEKKNNSFSSFQQLSFKELNKHKDTSVPFSEGIVQYHMDLSAANSDLLNYCKNNKSNAIVFHDWAVSSGKFPSLHGLANDDGNDMWIKVGSCIANKIAELDVSVRKPVRVEITRMNVMKNKGKNCYYPTEVNISRA